MLLKEGDGCKDIVFTDPHRRYTINGGLFVKAIITEIIPEMQQYGLAIVHLGTKYRLNFIRRAEINHAHALFPFLLFH